MQSGSVVYLMQQFAEIQQRSFFIGSRTYLNQVCTTYNVFQARESHFCQVFAYFLCQEAEEIDYITVMTTEVCPQLRILCSYSHRTSIGMTLTHHHTTQYNQYRGSESEFFCPQQSHADDIASGLQLSVGLQTHLSAESVEHQCLLCLAQTDFRRDTCVTHRRGRRSSRTAFRSGDDNQIGLGFCHTGCNGTDTTLGHQFHTDFSLRIDVLQIENQLSQIFDRIDIVMRGR